MNKLGLYRVLIDRPDVAMAFTNDIVAVTKWISSTKCEFRVLNYSQRRHYPNVTWSGNIANLEYIGELTQLEKVIYGMG